MSLPAAQDAKEAVEELRAQVALLQSRVKSFPDFPKKGIVFWDIFSAIREGPTCQLLQSILVATVRQRFPQVEAIIGLESRGFLFAFSIAQALGVGCVPVRKKGKLPGEVLSFNYELEYGTEYLTLPTSYEMVVSLLTFLLQTTCHNFQDTLEIQKSSIRPDLRCVIVDDLIATGGTLAASVSLLQSCGARVLGALVVLELESLCGRKNIPEGVPVCSLIQYD